jgi:diaminopimelate decarboxylase
VASHRAGVSRIDDCLSLQDGRLRVEGCDAAQLAERFGTPLHVVSEDQLLRNLRRVQTAFASAWPHGPVRLLPAFKANPALALRAVLDEAGAGCDAFGGDELEAVLRAGTEPSRISLNGPAKSDALLERAVRAGVRIAIDSPDELERAEAAAARCGRRALVRLRLRPQLAGSPEPTDLADGPLAVARAVLAYKPGIPEDALATVGSRIAASAHLEVLGVHMHLPRHRAEPELWAAAVRDLARLIGRLRAAAGGWTPREIDVGGGFPIPRDPAGRGLERRAGEPAPPPLEAFAGALGEALARALSEQGIEPAGIALEVEPGRSLYGDAGVHLTRVLHVKRQTEPEPWTWVETDTSEAFLPDGLIEHNGWTVLAATRGHEPPALVADVVGRSCGFDVLAAARPLPALEAGDVLAVLDTGAYQDAASSNFNAMPRPATVLVAGGSAELVRRRETAADVWARDVVPRRLGGTARLDHVGMAVADLDRALGFYRDLLGVRLRARGDDGGEDLEALTGLPGAEIRWADLDAGGGRVLELLEYRRPVAPAAPGAPNAPGVAHVGVQVADLAAVLERLRAAGARIRSRRPTTLHGGDWDGVTCLYVDDPDGLTVEVVQRPAG